MSNINIIGSILTILSIIGGVIGIVAFLIILYDHYKDDRLLNKRVRYFYNTIENLIFSNYVKVLIMQEHKSLKDLEKNTLEILNKHEIENEGYQVIVRRLLDDNAHYIGLFYDAGTFKFYVDFYIDGIKYLLTDNGSLNKFERNSENKIKKSSAFYNADKTKTIITNKEVKIITSFLEELRTYWKENYSKKRIFLRSIEKNLEFNKLLKLNLVKSS